MLKVKKNLRSAFSVMLVISMLLGLITGTQITVYAGTNIMANPGFEDIAGYKGAIFGASTLDIKTEQVHTGTNALKVTQSGNYAGVIFAAALENGKTYDYEVWVAFDSAAPGGSAIIPQIRFKNALGTTVERAFTSATIAAGDTTYKKLSGRFTFYENGPQSGFTYFKLYSNPTGTANNSFWVDDLSITEATDAPVITSTTPTNGSQTVNPIDLTAIVNFDRSMNTATFTATNITISGKLADGTTALPGNGDVRNSVKFDASNPNYVKVILNRIRFSLGSTVSIKFSNIKSSTGVLMGDFYLEFKIQTTYPDKYINQISNPGFEDNQQYVAGNANTYDTTLVHSGTNALRIAQSLANGTITFPAFYQPDKKYYYSAWVRLDPATAPSDTTTIYVNPTYKYYNGSSFVDSNNLVGVSGMKYDSPYTQLKGIFTPPPAKITDMNNLTQLQNMILNFYANPITGGTQLFTFYVDDLELREVDSVTSISSIPANGATAVPVSTRELKFDFSNEMDETSLSGNIKLNNSTALIQSTTVNPANKKQVIVTLNSDLELQTVYNISITGIKDIYTQAITTTSSFSTEGLVDLDPIIVSTYPANNATNVPLNSILTVEFDKDMDLSTVTAGNIKVNGATTLINTIQKTDSNKKVITIKLNELALATTYTVTLENLKSLNLGTLASQSIAFTTQSTTSLTNLFPNISFENILDTTSTGVYEDTKSFDSTYKKTGNYSMKSYQTASWGSLQLTTPVMQVGKSYSYSFWGRLDPDRAGGANQKLYLAVQHVIGNPANGNKSQEGVKSTGVLTPTGDFEQLSGIYTVPAGVGSSKFYIYSDGTGNVPSTFYVDDLEIKELPSAPTITSSVPANQSFDVSKTTDKIVVNFSQPVDPTTLIPANVKINAATTLISSIVASPDNLSCTINLNAALSERSYSVTFANVKDSYGQSLVSTPIVFYTDNYLMKFYKNYGEANVSEITDSNLTAGPLTGVVSYNNKSGSEINGMLVLAIYSQDKLVQCQATEIVIPQDAVNAVYTVNLNILDNPSLRTAKLIMLDDNLKPLASYGKLLEKDYTDGSDILSARSVTSIGDEYYIAKTMRKAMNGESVTIGFMGGSITEGAGATTPANCYAALVKDWWATKFPTANVVYKNAGIGATGSNVGVYRLNENLMTAAPDFVVVEYAVNDGNSSAVLPYYEQLVRTIAYSAKRPGVMLLFNTTSSGTNAQPQHSQIGTYYNLPMVSFRDAIYPELQNGRFTWADLYADTIHPNNKGHILLAKFVTDRLDKIYENINSYPLTPTDDAMKPIQFAPERYKDGVVLDSADITATMNGWTADHIANYSIGWSSRFAPGWQTSTPNATISFTVTGRSIGVEYRASNLTTSGTVSASVDGGTPIVINSYTTAGIGPVMAQLATNLEDTTHTVTFTMAATAGKNFAINGILVSK